MHRSRGTSAWKCDVIWARLPLTLCTSTSDDVDSEEAGSEDDDRPMTRDELKIKMLKSIAKRERKIIANDLGSIGGGLSVVSSNALKSASTKARRNRKALA